MLLLRSVLISAALTGALCAPAWAAEYAFDTNHTQANFSVVHLGFTRVSGRVPIVSGEATVAGNDLPTAINVTLSAKDIDTNSANRDRDLRSPDWFDVEKFPTMSFVAKSVSGTPQAFTVVGELTMHGVTKPVTLSAKALGKMTDARGRTHLGYNATTTIDRREWGLKWGNTTPGGALIAAYEVSIDLNVELVSK